MTRLAPNLRDKTYKQLVESAVAQLPGLSPEWTDYNAHDPGIAIMELLAWTTEAQIYGLARTRRGERTAYAKLLGATPKGATPASTLIWPKLERAMILKSAVPIAKNSNISVASAPGLNFIPSQDIHVLAAHVASVCSVSPNDKVIRHGNPINGDMTPFVPFGPSDSNGWSLRLELASNTKLSIFNDTKNVPCTFSLGFKTTKHSWTEAPVRVTLPEIYILSGGLRRKLHVLGDNTQKLRQTGIILVNVSEDLPLATNVTLELSYPRGPGNRNPITHIALNVIPIQQSTVHFGEAHVAAGSADETIKLEHGSLVTDDSASGIIVKTYQMSENLEWNVVSDFSMASPVDRVFTLDIASQTLMFGNGVNGKRLPAQQDVFISYLTSEGEAGNVAAGATWNIDGVAGLEFSNFNAATGGASTTDLQHLQIAARKKVKSMGIISRSSDLENAAEALHHLSVFFAAIVSAQNDAISGGLSLIVLRTPSPEDPFAVSEESSQWTDEIKAELLPRVPLGIKLNVQAVSRSIFRIHAKCKIADSAPPATVQKHIRQKLEERFGVAAIKRNAILKRIGRRFSKLDMIGFLQAIASITTVEQLTLSDANGRAIDKIEVSADSLAVLDYAGSTFTLLTGSGGHAQ